MIAKLTFVIFSLHVGGARTALYNWLLAKKGELDFNSGSAFVLRVEDTDLARSTKESEESVLADLQWLGLAWNEGPDMDAKYGPYRQSERTELYKKIAGTLLEEGNISEEDLNLFRVVDTAEEAVDHFNKFYAKYKLKPNF